MTQDPMAMGAMRFVILFFLVLLAHAPLLKLPFFWDEAGYYVPATIDLLEKGSLIAVTVKSTGHPPVVMAYIAAVWRLFGVSPFSARVAMCAWAALGLLGAYYLARRLTGESGARAAVIVAAAYPVFFVQSTLVQLDLPLTALSLWAFYAIHAGRWRLASLFLCVCAVTKATGILTAFAAALFVLFFPFSTDGRAIARPLIAVLVCPSIVLVAWHYVQYRITGSALGDSDVMAYNLSWLMSDPRRMAVASVHRIWHLTGHMGLWMLVIPALVMLWVRRRRWARPESPSRHAVGMAIACSLTYGIAFSAAGGAVLARYVLPAVALNIVVASSIASSLLGRHALVLHTMTFAAFLGSLFIPPPYHTAIEDGLMYKDFVQLHQQSAARLQTHFRDSPIITSWPATDELTKPYLGYVTEPLSVREIPDFGAVSVSAALDLCANCVLFVFNPQYEPVDSLLRPSRLLHRIGVWKRAQESMAVRIKQPLQPIIERTNARVEDSGAIYPHYTAILIPQRK